MSNVGSATTNSWVLIGHTTASTETCRIRRAATAKCPSRTDSDKSDVSEA
ncbi:hypothetical protein Ctob_015899 [Chrysochromulina tobinii]|uniref:Uncharacterized protein n=1 Tax=Chrysochromulina tobinii TaxID=1460289 RepID=A0A0M0K2G8_9EUKA|nr:hypothetical protein Ctob_015899 [Chrysochromulina tobinii]|eukprot:KOO32802.1 hypothetical protein Ctob_015899 [Chrysochromulina sp. CCMP291]